LIENGRPTNPQGVLDLSREFSEISQNTMHAYHSYRTMARSFSASLNELFKIDNSLADLDAAVDQK
jgi:hypothetical protein